MKNRFIKGDKVILPDGRVKEVIKSNNLVIVVKDIGNIGIYTKTFPLIKLYKKKSLDKYKTAILMCIKNHKINLKHEYQKDFIFNGSEKLLNSYKELTEVYADSRLIPLESVKLGYINKAMIEIIEILCPENFKEILFSINKIVSTNYSISETIFTELYSFIQLMEMTKNEEEIYKLDYSLVKNKGKKDV